jgi:L-threonylcarbamoyladenylate synthase
VTARVVADDEAGRAEAIDALRRGGIVAVPTDTVYGIASDLATPGGIERLFAAKRRPPEKGIVLLLADADQAAEVGEWPRGAAVLADRFWPGGLTLVLGRRDGDRLPGALTGGAPTIAVRLPDHAAPRALAAALGPLPTTSANVSGEPEAADAAEILARLGEAIELVLDGGPAAGGAPSTVVDVAAARPRVLREGAIPGASLAAALDAAGIDHAIAGTPGRHRRRDRGKMPPSTRREEGG